jgi:hypothetical protein
VPSLTPFRITLAVVLLGFPPLGKSLARYRPDLSLLAPYEKEVLDELPKLLLAQMRLHIIHNAGLYYNVPAILLALQVLDRWVQ